MSLAVKEYCNIYRTLYATWIYSSTDNGISKSLKSLLYSFANISILNFLHCQSIRAASIIDKGLSFN